MYDNTTRPDLRESERILTNVSADCDHKTWFKCNAAMKNTHGESAKEICRRWSQQSTKFNNAAFEATWKACNKSNISLGTLIHIAKSYGLPSSQFATKLFTPFTRKSAIKNKPIRNAVRSINQSAAKSLRRTLQQSGDIMPDDPVDRYFANRNIGSPVGLQTLRYHPNLAYYNDNQLQGHHPAMLALVSAPDGTLVNLLRIYVTYDGKKADIDQPKKLMTPAISGLSGSAVRLSMPTDFLAVTEGTETAVAVHNAFGWPVWSCISASGLESVAIPPTVRKLFIMADKDRNEVGLRAALGLQSRYEHRVECKILLPHDDIPEGEKSIDWADVLRRDPK